MMFFVIVVRVGMKRLTSVIQNNALVV